MAHYRPKIRRACGVWMQVIDPAAIRRWRKRRRLTQHELAYLCRCSQNTISLIEKGDLPTMSEDLALEIAHRLDVPWEDLFISRETSGARRSANGKLATGSERVPA